MVSIQEVQSRGALRRFIDFPYSFYKGNPYWVPQLRKEIRHTLSRKKNAFFEHGDMGLFLALGENGHVVGRIAGIRNGSHLETYDDGVGFFGFFECEERYETATALFEAAAGWVRAQGLTTLRGPTNPTLNDLSALLINGFDRMPSVLMPYNPPHYLEYLERWGFQHIMKIWAYFIHYKHANFDRLTRGAAIIKRRNPGITLRTLDMSNFYRDVQIMREIWNDGWENNWGFVPITEREVLQLAKEFKDIVDPRICYFVEVDQEPAAFSVSLPNINPALKKLPDGRLFPFGLFKILLHDKFGGFNEIRMPLMGVKKAYQGRAFDVLPVLETMLKAPSYGYEACETSWVLDSNTVLKNLLRSLGTAVDKEYALLEKDISETGQSGGGTPSADLASS